MKIAVVILNWNAEELLEKFLPSVIAHSTDANIYVADNASTDNSLKLIHSKFPKVKTILNSENGGYAKGYNDALKNLDEPILCLLNNDIEVSPNWLAPIIEEFENNKTTTIIQPKILDYNQKNRFEYAGAAGGFIDKFGYPYCRGRIFNTIELDENQYDDNAEVFWASGACLFIRNSVFRKLQGFDESFFAHMEEIDLCWRAYNLNYSSKFVADSVVYHVGGATLNNSNPKKTYLNFRNSLYTITKNADNPLFFLIIMRLLLDGIAGFKFLIEFKVQHTVAIIKAHFSYYRNFSRLLKQRRNLPQRSNYAHKTSIIWAYFIAQKAHFNRL